MKTEDTDCARSLREANTLEERRQMLNAPHIVPLLAFVANLREANPNCEFPDFDPCDGGVDAEILFLFEKPGPMTSRRGKGSGFISRNNDDPTAEATFKFMEEAGLTRKCTVIWNVIPGWNGTRKVRSAEILNGINLLRGLLCLLPNLHTIVLVGKKAQRAQALIEPLGLKVVCSAHPSPLVKASQPDHWRKIPIAWASANTPVRLAAQAREQDTALAQRAMFEG